MNKEAKLISGVLFILISSIFISAQFITAGILSINKNNWSEGTIYTVFNSPGTILFWLGIISSVIGLVLVVLSLKAKN
ncbi:hypothetical protein [Pontibacillus halophilus]|uniref:hypothetical protein n=1 Tax=Pontibacillus halophilus TaxID=516704 RepID=UPI00047C75E4|nr:hypothetical protein [Pontibacillus halophilus]